MRFTIKHHGIFPFRNCRPGISSRSPDLSPDQVLPDISAQPCSPSEHPSIAAKDPNMARIALLPLETVCQGNKRLQATPLTRDSENAFLRTHVFRENHARKMKTGFWKECTRQKPAPIRSFSIRPPNYRSSTYAIRRANGRSQEKHQGKHKEKRDCRELIAARQSRFKNITCRRELEGRTSYRAPAGNAHSGHRRSYAT